MDAFFQVHRDLPREGPGHRDVLDRALALAEVPEGARVLDAGCGPGADIAGLLAHAPSGSVVAVDAHAPFIDQVIAWHGDDPRVQAQVGDMRDARGPFDLVWCAGALYFLGLHEGLRVLGGALAPGGVMAFSHPCFFVDEPSAAAVAFWAGEGVTITGMEAVHEAVRAAGLDLLGSFALGDDAWEAYYRPIEARIEELAAGAGPALAAVIEAERQEAAGWRRVKGETGYLQVVARRP